MKKLNSLLPALIICCTILSCQKETIEDLSNSNSNSSIEYQEITNNLIISNTESTRGSTHTAFEGRMEWAAFIIGEILYHDSSNSYRGYFLNKSTIQLEELIGDTPFSSTFKVDFLEKLNYYINENPILNPSSCPGNEEDKPGGIINNETESLFMSSLIVDNCVELYFPVNMDFSEEDTLTTLSHPLTTSARNEGVKHYHNESCEEYNTMEVAVSPNYIFASGNINIIVLRPARDLIQCPYSEYGFNFTDFLSN